MKPIQSKILCAAFFAFLAMSGCKTAEVGGNSANSSTANSASGGKESTKTSADPKEAIVGSMKNLQQAKSWVADVNMSGDSMPQGNLKMTIKYAAPDSFQMENNIGETKMQIIAVGGKTYMQMGEKWQEAPASVNMAEMINKWKDMFGEDKMDAFKNIQSAGKETLNGKEMAVYTYEIDQQAAMPEEMKKDMTDEVKKKLAEMKSENKAKVWIDESKNLPVKMEMVMKMSTPKEMTQNVSVDYKYDEEVKIEAPKLK